MNQKPLGPEDIERARLAGATPRMNELCELALDGLRFRIWCEGASWPNGDPSRLANLLTYASKPEDYRKAIDQFIVDRARGKR